MYSVASIRSFPKLAGIYKFVNKRNGKIYIGESKNMKGRMNHYTSHTQESRPMIKAFKKYGFDGFDYYVVESFPLGTPKKILLDREEFWISFYRSLNNKIGYNMCPRGTDGTGRVHSKSTRLKIRQFRLGRKHSPETRKRLSETHKGEKHWQYGKSGPETSFWGKKLSDSHKKALLDANVGIPKPYRNRKIHQINLKTGETVKTWGSLREAAIGFFQDQKCELYISRVVRGARKKYKGFGWVYAETPKVMTKKEAAEKFNSQL